MPISASQHRVSAGVHNNFRGNSTQVQGINPNRSAMQDEIRYFGSSINSVVNSHKELNKASYQKGIAVPLLMLLSQVKLTDSPLSATSAFVSGNDISISVVGNTGRSSSDDNSFSAMFSPITHALYETGQFISQLDPLRFPEADATALPSAETDSTMTTDNTRNIKDTFLSDDLASKVIKLIKSIKSDKDRIAITNVINKLNNITLEAEKKFPSGSAGDKNIDHLIYLIDQSKFVIADFEIKYSQNGICSHLRLQLDDYIKIANNLSDNKSVLKFKRYIEAIPPLTFTPDSRGEGYPSVESQIAGNLVRSVYWLENEEGHSAVNGLRYDAHKALLTCLLAEKNLGDLNKLPSNWYKGDEALRLFNILFRDLKSNVKNKGQDYLFRPARLFYSSLCKIYTGESVLNIKGLDKKTLSSYSDEDKLLALTHYFNQPVDIEYNLESKVQRFFKIIELFFIKESISELIRPGSFSAGMRHRGSKQKTDISEIYGNRSRGKAKNYKLKIDESTNELTIEATYGKGLKRQQRINHENKIILDNHKIGILKFKTSPTLSNKKSHAHLSKEVRNKIQPDMYVKDIDTKKLSPPNDMGLMSDKNGKKYIKVNNSYLEIKQENGNNFIRKNNGGVIHLEYRKGKFHLESDNKRISRIKHRGFSGRQTRPSHLIANKLNISETEAEAILSKYEFPRGSELYTKQTFALSVKETGQIPSWAESFEKIDTNNYISPFKGNKNIGNGLNGFHGKDGYYYRADRNLPETVLQKGFETSSDYSAISKMLPDDVDGVIVSGNLEGAQRYQTINKNLYIYKIKGENIEGVSLKDNLYKNEQGLNKFLEVDTKHTTLASLAEDTNGAIYLDEIHLVKKTITPEAISVVPVDELYKDLSPGPWKDYL